MQVTQITLQASPNIIENVLEYLNHFSKTDLQIIATQQIPSDDLNVKNERVDISQMGGILSKYVDKPISDAEIEEAITQGICQRVMIK